MNREEVKKLVHGLTGPEADLFLEELKKIPGKSYQVLCMCGAPVGHYKHCSRGTSKQVYDRDSSPAVYNVDYNYDLPPTYNLKS